MHVKKERFTTLLSQHYLINEKNAMASEGTLLWASNAVILKRVLICIQCSSRTDLHFCTLCSLPSSLRFKVPALSHFLQFGGSKQRMEEAAIRICTKVSKTIQGRNFHWYYSSLQGGCTNHLALPPTTAEWNVMDQLRREPDQNHAGFALPSLENCLYICANTIGKGRKHPKMISLKTKELMI